MIGRKPPRTETETSNLKGFDDFTISLGDVMRGERATLGKSLLDVQRELRIKAAYIVAIENADAQVFDTPGFVAGYVRSYSRYLGLDPEWAFEKFCEESGFVGVHGMQPEAGLGRTKADAPAPRKRSKKPRVEDDPVLASATALIPQRGSVLDSMNAGAVGSLVVLTALLGLLGYGGYTILQEVQRVTVAPVDTPPGVTPQVDPLSSAALTDPAVRDAEIQAPTTEALNRLYRPEALEVPILTARDGPIATIDPRSVGVWRTPPTPSGLDTAVAEADLADEARPVQVVAPPPPAVAIVAVDPAWVRVRAADGTILLEKILAEGETFVLPNSEEPATLRAGNSGSVYFLVDGETYGPAGAPGAVASNVSLARASLSESYVLTDLDADPGLREVIATAEASLIEPDPTVEQSE